jgi:hypothetical protein
MKPVQMERAPGSKKRFSLEIHELELPTECCPVSKNPFPGSKIFIGYLSRHCLEVGSVLHYLHSFIGGLKNAQGELLIRDQEGMICEVADEASRKLRTFTFTYARLVIKPREIMHLFTIGIPWRKRVA